MSFIGGGAECAANANPLAQFNKHSQNDTSLQQSMRSGSEMIQQNPTQIREQMMMGQQDRAQMESFMNQSGPQENHFNFEPMASEINIMHQHQQQHQHLPQHHLTEQFNQMQMNPTDQHCFQSGWSSEFIGTGNVPVVQQQVHHHPQPQMRHAPMMNRGIMNRGMMMSGLGGGMMMNRVGPMRNMAMDQQPLQQSSSAQASADQVGDVNWEQQFNEVEGVASEKRRQLRSKESALISLDEVQDTYAANTISNDEFLAQMEENQKQWEKFSTESYADNMVSNDDFAAMMAENRQRWEDQQGNTYADNTVSNDEFQAQWEKDFEKYAQTRMNYGEYQIEEKNQFSQNTDAYEIGLKLMESGAKLSEAALAFEAAVEQNPGHVDAWLRLGQVQTQNEKELAGIAALEKALELDNQNLTALMTLAISYVNEGYDNAAYATLERWIETKYPEVAERARAANPEIQADDRYALNKRVTELFIKAAQISPTGANMDADVQTGLGVLFYSMEEYDKTMDCFQAAITRNPNDALSWNRLGASLANSNRPEQAVEAYSRALNLNPNFVRARYNLGVSFINMGMYKDAVEHLLTGLSMHEVEPGTSEDLYMNSGDSNQSTSLIETLKRAFLAMDRRDLIDKVRPGMNVESFRKVYGV
uniref:Peroxisomal targeting signal receptor n=1 Tax=Ogataea methanolica TaxID=1156966 RepID=A6P659_OGAME|nr:peroxisomal targeting signal receptor [Ogataea methanolica]